MMREHDPTQPPTEPEDEEPLPTQLPPLTATNLGISIETVEKGVAVIEVYKNSLAEKMELKSGDIITAINNSQTTDAWECRRLVKEALASGKIKLNIIREGKEQTKTYPQ